MIETRKERRKEKERESGRASESGRRLSLPNREREQEGERARAREKRERAPARETAKFETSRRVAAASSPNNKVIEKFGYVISRCRPAAPISKDPCAPSSPPYPS